ncbi:MAG: hypothetical protein WEA36_10770 [Balneolaceae bacterium]
MNWLDWFTTGISIIAVAISFWTWYRTDKRDRDRRRDEIRKRDSAEIRAYLKKEAKYFGPTQIVIENKGNSEARLKSIQLDGTPILKYEGIYSSSTWHDFLGPDSKIFYEIENHGWFIPPHYIEIIWDDEYKDGNRYRNSLSY